MGSSHLRRLRTSRALTADQAAEVLGTTRSQYVKLERGDRRLSDKWIERAARGYGIDPADVLGGVRPPEVIGSVEADATIAWSSNAPAPLAAGRYAVLVGQALGVVLDGWMLCFDAEQLSPGQLPADQMMIATVLGGADLLAKVHSPTHGHGLWHLMPIASPPRFDQRLAYVRRIVCLSPPAATEETMQ